MGRLQKLIRTSFLRRRSHMRKVEEEPRQEEEQKEQEEDFLNSLKEQTVLRDQTLKLIPISTIEEIVRGKEPLEFFVPQGEDSKDYIQALVEYKEAMEKLGHSFREEELERITSLTSVPFQVTDRTERLIPLDHLKALMTDPELSEKFLDFENNKDIFGNISKEQYIEALKQYEKAVSDSSTLALDGKEQEALKTLLFDRDLTHYGMKFVPTVDIDSKFKEEILKDLPKCTSQTELSHELYKRLNERVRYNESYFATPFEEKRAANQRTFSQTIDSFNQSNPFVICKSWSEMYSKLLSDYGIENVISQNGKHFWVTLLADHEVIKADGTNATPSMFDNTGNINDIQRASFGMPTGGFTIISNYEKNVALQKKEYERALQEEQEVDLAFLREDPSYDEDLAKEILSGSIEERVTFLNKQFTKLPQKGGLDMISYISCVRSKVFPKEWKDRITSCTIGVPIGEENYKASLVYTYQEAPNMPQQYYFLSDNGLEGISQEALKEKFSAKEFCRIREDSYVPGVIEKNGHIAKEKEEVVAR